MNGSGDVMLRGAQANVEPREETITERIINRLGGIANATIMQVDDLGRKIDVLIGVEPPPPNALERADTKLNSVPSAHFDQITELLDRIEQRQHSLARQIGRLSGV